VPSSDILGGRAKAGAIDHEELLRAYVTAVYFSTGQNKAETARLTGFHRRTVGSLIDPVRLARLIAASQ
jgi:ActR/RegA family two-component response regulator